MITFDRGLAEKISIFWVQDYMAMQSASNMKPREVDAVLPSCIQETASSNQNGTAFQQMSAYQ
jgi:hypothetical protein